MVNTVPENERYQLSTEDKNKTEHMNKNKQTINSIKLQEQNMIFDTSLERAVSFETDYLDSCTSYCFSFTNIPAD